MDKAGGRGRPGVDPEPAELWGAGRGHPAPHPVQPSPLHPRLVTRFALAPTLGLFSKVTSLEKPSGTTALSQEANSLPCWAPPLLSTSASSIAYLSAPSWSTCTCTGLSALPPAPLGLHRHCQCGRNGPSTRCGLAPGPTAPSRANRQSGGLPPPAGTQGSAGRRSQPCPQHRSPGTPNNTSVFLPLCRQLSRRPPRNRRTTVQTGRQALMAA